MIQYEQILQTANVNYKVPTLVKCQHIIQPFTFEKHVLEGERASEGHFFEQITDNFL